MCNALFIATMVERVPRRIVSTSPRSVSWTLSVTSAWNITNRPESIASVTSRGKQLMIACTATWVRINCCCFVSPGRSETAWAMSPMTWVNSSLKLR